MFARWNQFKPKSEALQGDSRYLIRLKHLILKERNIIFSVDRNNLITQFSN
uniref:Transposase n=1 Tax=Heterorhabditis bacteriophora TaxID=37862 RepID=A0A1I7WK46_HETBA